VSVSRVGPGRKACDNVEFPEKAANHLIRVSLGAESIELRHHLRQRAFDVGNSVGGVELALLFEAPPALDELFTIKIRNGMEYRIALGAGIGQEA